MRPIGRRGETWLKACHVLFAACWLVAAAILTLVFFFVSAGDSRQPHKIYRTAKLIMVAGVLFGVFWLGPRLNALPRIAQELGIGALVDPEYTRARAFLLVAAPLQVSSLVLALLLCVLKPWQTEASGAGEPR